LVKAHPRIEKEMTKDVKRVLGYGTRLARRHNRYVA